MGYDISCLVDCRCRLGESLVWDAAKGRILWADITARRIHAYTLASEHHEVWDFASEVGAFGLCPDGRLVVGLRDGVSLFDPASGTLDPLVAIEADNPDTRLNDGKVGPDGAFWIGSMDDRPERKPIAALYRVTADGACERKVDGLMVSNGLAWSADARRMFHSDSSAGRIDIWDFDPADGAMSGRRLFAELTAAQGRPDGAATDIEGGYWSAGVSGGNLNRFSATGELVQSIPLPVPAPTMCAFGGEDMRTLFLTSLCDGRPAELIARYPLSGSILMLRVDVEGVPVGQFGE
jgi:sugar lactone lactonase YvrE